jgi:hypothetical protein
MPTNPLLPITELDFFQAKNQLKEFLRNDPSGRFRDIDFEGSNISVLLDVLSYNTYQNNFYTNMAISEMFLDSAQLENSVVSHAKELNYLPRSAKSSKAVVNVHIKDSQNTESTISIPEGTRFTTNQGGDRFNFFTNETYIARKVGENYVAENIEIFEGELIEEGFIFTGNQKSIRLINNNIDVSSIKVFENFDEPLDRIEYTVRNDIFGVGSNDPVFYIEPSFDNTYEIFFGNNRFGREPGQNTQIRVLYRISSGSAPNGACRFTGTIKRNTNNTSSLTNTVTTVSNAMGGAERESLEDIKFFAPRSIQVQERAVTERDYEILLKQRFNEIQDISVFGGDELDPPRFGRVAIVVNIEGGLSEIASQRYNSFLKDKTPTGIQPIILPPEFLFIDLDINVAFSSKQTSQSKASVEQEVRKVLNEYNSIRLNKFAASFEVSRVSFLIDQANIGIINNTIRATPYMLYSPDFNERRSPTFNFGSSLETPCKFARSNNTESYNSFVQSSIFTFNGVEALFEDNGLGAINIINARNRSDGQVDVIRRNAGTVDYQSGIVKLSDFVIDSYSGNGIKIFANTADKNITAPKRRVLILNDQDIKINIREVTSI